MQNDKSLLRTRNEKRILQEVFGQGAISRSQISKNIGLNKVTVSEIVVDLMNKGYLVEQGQGDSTHNGGRKPTILKFNRDMGYILSVDFGPNFVDIMANRMDGTIVTMKRVNPSRSAEFIIGDIVDLVTSYRAQNNLNSVIEPIPLAGVAVAIHGIIDQNKVVESPFFDFKGLDIAQILESRLSVPVILQNESNLAAIYERDFSNREPTENLVCVSINEGISAGIIIHNQLYTGLRGEAGEIGHLLVSDDESGSFKMIKAEALYAESAILKRISSRMGANGLDIEELVTRYRDGQQIVQDYLQQFCQYVATAIYNLVVTVSPDRIAIKSELIARLPELMVQIRANLEQITQHKVIIDVVDDVRKCSLLGGCSMIIHHLLEMESGDLRFNTTI